MADLADRTATEQRRIRRLNRVGLYIFVTGLGFVAFAVVQGLLRLRGAL